jgi:hypothetical protein
MNPELVLDSHFGRPNCDDHVIDNLIDSSIDNSVDNLSNSLSNSFVSQPDFTAQSLSSSINADQFQKGIWSVIGSQQMNPTTTGSTVSIDSLDLHLLFDLIIKEIGDIFTFDQFKSIIHKKNEISNIMKSNVYDSLKIDLLRDAIISNCAAYNVIDRYLQTYNNSNVLDITELYQMILFKFPVNNTVKAANIELINKEIVNLIDIIKIYEYNIKKLDKKMAEYNVCSKLRLIETEKEYINLLSDFYDLLYDTYFDLTGNIKDPNILLDVINKIILELFEIKGSKSWFNKKQTTLENNIIKYIGSDDKLYRLKELVIDRRDYKEYHSLVNEKVNITVQLNEYQKKLDLIKSIF